MGLKVLTGVESLADVWSFCVKVTIRKGLKGESMVSLAEV